MEENLTHIALMFFPSEENLKNTFVHFTCKILYKISNPECSDVIYGVIF